MERGYDTYGGKGTLDAGAAARSGCWFGMTKSTEGGDFNDPLFNANRTKILSANQGRCVSYHYCHPEQARGFFMGSPSAAAVELEHIISVVGPLGPSENIMIDFEEPKGYRDDAALPAYMNLDVWLWALADGLRQHYGRAPIIYTFADFWHRHIGNSPRYIEFPLNLAAYQSTQPTPPPPWSHLTFWQYTSSATIPGINGKADADYFFGEQREWDAMCGLHVTPTEDLLRDERIIHIPAPDAHGRQWVATDVNGNLLAKASLTSSAQVWAQDDGSWSDAKVEPYAGYQDLLALAIRNAAGTGPAPEGNVRVIIERR